MKIRLGAGLAGFDPLRTVSFCSIPLHMRPLKHLPIALFGLALMGCSAGEAGDQSDVADFETPYADAPIAPRPDDVQFFERPKLLSKMRNESAPMPEVVLIERDPWKQVIGSDSPRLALYEDGKVIYRAGDGYRSVRLSAVELRSFRKSLVMAHDKALSGGYHIALATDQPDNDLLLYRGEPVFLSVYGSLNDEEVSSRLPRPVRDAYEAVRSFRHARSERWVPEKIEVMV